MELIVVVGMIGAVTLVTIPALNQLMPQYRTRAAASEMAASLRMLRSQALGVRNDFRMTVNPVSSCECYTLAQADGASWIPLGENGKPTPSGQFYWKHLDRVDLTGASVYTITMQRDGTPSAAVSIVLDSVKPPLHPKYDRYTVAVAASGNITITPSKK